MVWGDVITCATTFVFLRLIASPKSVDALAKRSIKDWRWDELCATLARFALFILSYLLSERYRTVYRQFGYANKHPNWMCQKHVKKNSKTKMQKVLVLARSLTCHHSEFQNARSHSHCTAQQSFSKCTHVHSSERNNYFTVHRRYL